METARIHRSGLSYPTSNYSTLYGLFNRMIGCGGGPIMRKQDVNREPVYRKYLNNYFVQKGIAASCIIGNVIVGGVKWTTQTTVSKKLLETFCAKRQFEMVKVSFDFFKPYFGNEKGKRLYTACLAMVIVLNMYQSYLYALLGKANGELYALENIPTITLDNFWNATYFCLSWLLVQTGLTLTRTVAENWLRHNLVKEVYDKYLDKLAENNGFYGINLIQKKTSDDSSSISTKLIKSLQQTDSSIVTTFDIIEKTISQMFCLYSILFKSGTLILPCIIYGLFVKPFLDYIIQKCVKNNTEEEKRLDNQFNEAIQHLFSHSESIALRNIGETKIKNIKAIYAETLVNNHWKLPLDGYFSILSSMEDVLALLFTAYVLCNQILNKRINIRDLIITRYNLSNALKILNTDQHYATRAARIQENFKVLEEVNQVIKMWNDSMEHRQLTIIKNNSEQPTVKFQGKIKVPVRPADGKNFKTIISTPEPITLTPKPGEHKWIRIDADSGAGKSTFLRTLAGLWPLAEGTSEIPEKTEFLPQQPFIPSGYMKLRDIICPPEMKELPFEEEDKIVKMMDKVGLKTPINAEADWSTFSGGEKQKIALIAALIKNPKCLFLDEFTSGMDEVSRENAHELVRKTLPNAIIVYTDHRPLKENTNEIVYEITDAGELKRVN